MTNHALMRVDAVLLEDARVDANVESQPCLRSRPKWKARLSHCSRKSTPIRSAGSSISSAKVDRMAFIAMPECCIQRAWGVSCCDAWRSLKQSPQPLRVSIRPSQKGLPSRLSQLPRLRARAEVLMTPNVEPQPIRIRKPWLLLSRRLEEFDRGRAGSIPSRLRRTSPRTVGRR